MSRNTPVSVRFDRQCDSLEATVQRFIDRTTVQLAQRPVRRPPRMHLVEDDGGVARAYRALFKQHATVDVSTRGAEAIASIAATSPRVVVIDLQLSDDDPMNGLDVAAALDGPMLVLSSGHEAQIDAACERFNVAAVLHKPPRPGEIDAVIALLNGPPAVP